MHSYEDRLDFGLVSDRDLLPDLWDLVDLHIEEIDHLFEASGAEYVVPQPPPAGRRGAMPKIEPPKKPAAKKKAAKKKAAKKKVAKRTPAKKTAAKKPAKTATA